MRQTLRAVLGSATLALALALAVTPAVTPPAAADGHGYAYLPGHPMIHTYGGTAQGGFLGHCTGGYAVAGTSGVFLLGARDCVLVRAPVLGIDRELGMVDHANATSVLVSQPPSDDAFQLVVDPLTGAVPADGWIRGVMPTAEQGQGVLVGKMGAGSGWTEGRVTGWIDYRGNAAICTDARTVPGDAGGPVWRWDEQGLRALGVVVAYHPGTGGGCYLPIEAVLASWGAWLPVPGGVAVVDGPGTLAQGLPQLDAAGYTTPIRYEPVAG